MTLEQLRSYKKLSLTVLAAGALLLGFSGEGAAQVSCPGVVQCNASYVPGVSAYCGQNGSSCCDCETTRTNLSKELDKHRRGGEGKKSFLFDTLWNESIDPSLRGMLSKNIQAAINQTTSLGSFLNAQTQNRAQGSLQKGAAEAARDYAVSDSLCRFGSLSLGLASADMGSKAAQLSLASIGINRNIGGSGSIAQAGASMDRAERMNGFIREYCDASDNNNGLALMCGTDPQRSFEDIPRDARKNRDIDFLNTFIQPSTLDFGVGTAAEDIKPGQQDIISLAHNLYGHQQLAGRQTDNQLNSNAGQGVYLKIRSVVASRGVAQNSYAAIAGLKSQGSGGSKAYMNAVYRELGMTEAQAQSNLGEQPSYYAQMDVLTKKLYQNPNFYANLMEGKTNVARQSGAMEGLELMQDRDIYLSMKRSEMLLAMMVQMQTRKLLTDTAADVNVPATQN